MSAPSPPPDHPDHPEPLAPRLDAGRVFSGRRKVRLGDVDPRARLRLDALTRYTQDVSDDDTTDAGLDERPGWVVRSTVVDEVVPAGLGEWLRFETFCSGVGSRWAERRLTVVGERGAHYEVATVWVCIDADTGRPHRLTGQFLDLYGSAAGDRPVSARQVNRPLPAESFARPGDGAVMAWQLRVVDFDIYGHVNNAAYWAAVEQRLGRWHAPRRVRLEYGAGVGQSPDELVDHIDILVDDGAVEDGAVGSGGDHGCFTMWWLPDRSNPKPAASAEISPLGAEVYPASPSSGEPVGPAVEGAASAARGAKTDRR